MISRGFNTYQRFGDWLNRLHRGFSHSHVFAPKGFMTVCLFSNFHLFVAAFEALAAVALSNFELDFIENPWKKISTI